MTESPDHFSENALDLLQHFPDRLDQAFLKKSHKTIGNDPLTYHPSISYRTKHRILIRDYHFNSPKTKTRLAQQLKQTANWALRNDLPIHNLKATGMGQDAMFITMGTVGLRVSPCLVYRLDHPLMLPALYTQRDMWLEPQGNWFKTLKAFQKVRSTIELLPHVDCRNTTVQQVKDLRDTAEQQGLYYVDPHTGNQGWYQAKHWDAPRQVIIDPHAAYRKGFPFCGF